jgi:hypothetical protein
MHSSLEVVFWLLGVYEHIKGLPVSLRTLSFEKCHPLLEEQLKKLKFSYNTA